MFVAAIFLLEILCMHTVLVYLCAVYVYVFKIQTQTGEMEGMVWLMGRERWCVNMYFIIIVISA